MEREICSIVSNDRVAKDIYKLVISSKSIIKEASAGQFLHIKPSLNYDPLLRRPISICKADLAKGHIVLLYRVCGKGTRLFGELREGDCLDIMGPLGKGFPILKDKKAAVIGGGIGIAPLLELCQNLNSPDIYMGFRDEVYFVDEFIKHSDAFFLYTEDGSRGSKGYPIEALARNISSYEVVYACGPKMMLSKVKELCETNSVECYLSMEERMGCGVGACLVCACESSEESYYKKVCVDGPVFNSREVKFDDRYER
ncbi:dihydroorotate dehydrogenase electron transfer subunit [Lutispora sp.]|uniref:dihydroorotate dehydrogenase electron transfer subunit n=1 Tax=Lutispora sp. TaxID=2828727 RepID=UPI000ECC7CF3|nr:dihydroorotate dehydrogenase electron transfer subunit [Lutispora sp.]MEA4962043.1 dihydroorotate dehydrogenase electron transfer subunit [Lutispora sp.]HCJ56997.1 dihydroorotate dehydrogenase electron transfer subunit [Clostridiaceae bacterium]